MYILGISAMEHDPAAALVGEHGVVAAMEEGKLARTRTFEGIPRAAIQFCLNQAGIGWAQVHRIAIASRPTRGWSRQALLRARLAPLAPISSSYFVNKAFGQLGTELNNFRILRDMAGPPRGRILPADHHLCHAASAYYSSDFDRALVLSLDESGGGRSGMAAIGEGKNIREIASVAFPHSLAWVFTQVTQLIGFRRRNDEHKTQWLSLAGEPVFAPLFLEILRRHPQGPPHLDAKYFRRGYSGELSFSANFYRRLGFSGIPGPESQMGDPLRANMAVSIQNACATIVSEWLEALRRRTGESNLALAGGLFLNPLLVAEVEKNTGFDEIFVQPAAGNEGTALGAAALAWHAAPKRPRLPAMSHIHYGPAYSNEEIKSVLDNCKAAYRWCDSEERILEETLRLLQGGKIVAWFQGRAEFGPRALGHRSLLASPWAPYVKENLNDYVKHRESFRPFALSVPAGDVPAYFDCSANTRFMTTMATATEKGRRLLEALPPGFLLPGNLVRLHAVTQDENPLLWNLLKRSGEKAPAPMLVNTSFNLFGEPLVITPRDAVRSYYCSGADALVIGSFLLSKR
ncbi:MAG: carbamoyltransferase C-terminal domain-containing protein [Candidatus Acidiferrales bacterium]